MKSLLLTAYLGCFTADAISTHQGLRNGGHELFLTQSPYTNDAILAGQAAGLYWLTEKILKDKPKLKWTLRIAAAATHGIAAFHNFHEMSR